MNTTPPQTSEPPAFCVRKKLLGGKYCWHDYRTVHQIACIIQEEIDRQQNIQAETRRP